MKILIEIKPLNLVKQYYGVDVMIDETIWKFIKKHKNGIGSVRRAKNRRGIRFNAQLKVIKILSSNHQNWLDGSIKKISEDNVAEVVNSIELVESSREKLKFAQNFLFFSLKNGNDLGIWDSALPKLFRTEPRESPIRAENDVRLIFGYRQLSKRFIQYLRTTQSFNSDSSTNTPGDSENLIQSIYLSACIFGGLSNKNSLNALFPSLIKREVCMAEGLVWVDLYVFDKNKDTTNNSLEPNARIQRWYPDLLTLSLISQWYQKDAAANILSAGFSIKWLRQFNVLQLSKISERAFFGVSALVYELDNPMTPSFLRGFLRGENESHSLPQKAFLSLFGIYSDQSTKEEPLHTFKNEKIISSPTILKLGSNKRLPNNFIKSLYECYRKPIKCHLKKISLIERIENLLKKNKGNLLIIEQLLAHWVIFMLRYGTKNSRAVAISTTKTYLSTLYNPIVAEIGYDNLLDYDRDKWIEKVDSFISNTESVGVVGSKRYSRFKEFYFFLTKMFELPVLGFTEFNLSESGRGSVASNYISECLFEEILEKFDEVPNLSKKDVIGFRMLLLLAYRCGLRKSELVNLRIKDIFISAHSREHTLRVRIKPKRSSSRRNIPLNEFLTVSESHIFFKWVEERRELNKNHNRALFLLSYENCIELEIVDIDRLTRKLLKKVCRDETVTFHTLRHSAISNFFISAFILKENWPFDPKNYPKIAMNEEVFVGKGCVGTGKMLYVIAELSGHASPRDTMKSYIHFLDLLQLQTRCPLNENIPLSLIANLLGKKEDSVRRFLDRKNKDVSQLLKLPIYSLRKHARLFNKSGAMSEINISDPFKNDYFDEKKITPYFILRVLNGYESSLSITELSEKFMLPEKRVISLIDVAVSLAEIKTKKEFSRLISKHSLRRKIFMPDGTCRKPIAPRLSNASAEKELAKKLVLNMCKELESENDLTRLLKFLKMCLSRVSTNKPGIRATKLGDVKFLVNCLSRWTSRCTIFISHEGNTYNETEFRRVFFSLGEDDKDLLEKKQKTFQVKMILNSSLSAHSTRALNFAAHLMTIAVLFENPDALNFR